MAKNNNSSDSNNNLDKSLNFYNEIGQGFFVQKAIHALLKRNILKSVNTLLLGPTGVGKTELVDNIARELNLPITIFDMGTMTDPISSIVGTHVIEVKSGVATSNFKRSRFSEVVKEPGIVLLDEISRASAASNNLLFPCLDFRRTLAMEYDFTDNTPIKIHDNCVFIATANLGSQYTGTHKLDKALLDRFMSLEIDPLPHEAILKLALRHFPDISDEKIETIVNAYSAINSAHDNFKISFGLSIRHLKMICKMVEDGFTIYDSFYLICKGIGNIEGAKAMEAILAPNK